MDSLGPKDLRRRRHRCVQCVSAHVKCSGLLPCIPCTRRGQYCVYPPSKYATILIEKGRHLTPRNMLSDDTVAPLCFRKNAPHIDQFFETFIPTNGFSWATSAWSTYLRMHIGHDVMVASSITACGALHAYQSMQAASKNESLVKHALVSYQQAVTALRKKLSFVSKDANLYSALSVMFLLGLFELMYDQTGDGWKQHMMYGISRLLDLNEPDVFHSAEVKSLYREIRLFEISRAVLLSQSTPLSQPSWQSFHQNLLTSWEPSHPMEAVVDLILSCADLSRRIHHYKDVSDVTIHDHVLQLQNFAADGFVLQERLLDQAKTIFNPQPVDYDDEHTSLARLYYFATTIYLSGAYDYDGVWQTHGISTPTLSRPFVEEYVIRLLEYSSLAIESSNMSHLLLLIPLRIAAARCWTLEQQRRIEDLLLKIQATFAVACAFLTEIREMWALRALRALDAP